MSIEKSLMVPPSNLLLIAVIKSVSQSCRLTQKRIEKKIKKSKPFTWTVQCKTKREKVITGSDSAKEKSAKERKNKTHRYRHPKPLTHRSGWPRLAVVVVIDRIGDAIVSQASKIEASVCTIESTPTFTIPSTKPLPIILTTPATHRRRVARAETLAPNG